MGLPNATQAEGSVGRILKTKQANPAADVSPLARALDHRVYRLHGLTPKEINIVGEACQ